MKSFVVLCCLFWGFHATAQDVQIIRLDALERAFTKANDTTYIVNFFASWCAPCIKELPNFTRFAKEQQTEKVKLIFVSLDFKKTYQESLLPILDKYGIKQVVFLLDETNPNTWIPKIDPNWSGAIPATLFINAEKGYKGLVENSFTTDLLHQKIKNIVDEK